MSQQFNYFRVSTMPGTPIASSIYAVQGPNATEAELYIIGTNATEVRHLITAQEVDTKIASANTSNAEMVTTATIATRDLMTLTQNQLVLVVDASGDTTVDAGKAVYFYTHTDTSWTKMYEFEGMDVTLTWADITNKPTQPVGDIDTAATRAVAHTQTVAAIDLLVATLTANQAVLAGFTEDVDGNVVYNGVALDRKCWMGDSGDAAYTPDW